MQEETETLSTTEGMEMKRTTDAILIYLPPICEDCATNLRGISR